MAYYRKTATGLELIGWLSWIAVAALFILPLYNNYVSDQEAVAAEQKQAIERVTDLERKLDDLEAQRLLDSIQMKGSSDD